MSNANAGGSSSENFSCSNARSGDERLQAAQIRYVRLHRVHGTP